MDFILVLAKIEPKEGCQDSIIEVSKDLIFETLQEPGNIDYHLLKSIEDDTLTFVEKWESVDFLKKHMASPHFINFEDESEEFIRNMTIEVIGAENIDL